MADSLTIHPLFSGCIFVEVFYTCFVFIYLIPVMPLNFLDSPAGDTLSVAHPASRPVTASGTPDLLINSLELKRTFRKWSHDKEKVGGSGNSEICFYVTAYREKLSNSK